MMIAKLDNSSRGAEMREPNLRAFRSQQVEYFGALQGE